MKSKVILLAFIIALALSSFTSKANYSSQIGYWDNPFIPGIQSGLVECGQFASQVNCLKDGYQVYYDASLTTPLYKVF